jgi:ABC-type transport system involved in multi-copper enzyme maturation permease subunit
MTALTRLELASVLRARWLAASSAIAALGVVFFLALASRESSIVRFTGFGRVVDGVGTAALLVLPLLAVFASAQAVTAARSRGVLEWLLSHPVSRAQCFRAMLLPRLGAVLAPVVVAVLVLAVAAALGGQPIAPLLLLRLLALLAGQAACFTAIGFLVSITAPSSEQALLRGLGVWLAAVALLDFALIGLMLRFHLPPAALFWLSAINPVQAGRLGLLGGTDPELGVLGPVGTYIATTLGPTATLAYALGWPLVVAAVAVAVGRWRFQRGDLL